MADQVLDKIDFSDRSTKLALVSLALVGTYQIGTTSLMCLKSLAKYFILPAKDHMKRYGGGWALITGASDGLGKAYALELAREGFNIILLSRSMDKTSKVAQEIAAEYKVKTKALAFDFGKLDTVEAAEQLRDLIETETKDLDISILINNVGALNLQLLEDETISDVHRLLTVNVNAQSLMTLIIVPRLLARESRSAIIDLSSKAAFYNRPVMPMYCATKCYNFGFSQACR